MALSVLGIFADFISSECSYKKVCMNKYSPQNEVYNTWLHNPNLGTVHTVQWLCHGCKTFPFCLHYSMWWSQLPSLVEESQLHLHSLKLVCSWHHSACWCLHCSSYGVLYHSSWRTTTLRISLPHLQCYNLFTKGYFKSCSLCHIQSFLGCCKFPEPMNIHHSPVSIHIFPSFALLSLWWCISSTNWGKDLQWQLVLKWVGNWNCSQHLMKW